MSPIKGFKEQIKETNWHEVQSHLHEKLQSKYVKNVEFECPTCGGKTRPSPYYHGTLNKQGDWVRSPPHYLIQWCKGCEKHYMLILTADESGNKNLVLKRVKSTHEYKFERSLANIPNNPAPYCLIPPCHCVIKPDAETLEMIRMLRAERERNEASDSADQLAKR